MKKPQPDLRLSLLLPKPQYLWGDNGDMNISFKVIDGRFRITLQIEQHNFVTEEESCGYVCDGKKFDD